MFKPRILFPLLFFSSSLIWNTKIMNRATAYRIFFCLLANKFQININSEINEFSVYREL